MISGKTIFITGGTGTLGTYLVKKLLKNNKIIIYSRNEYTQYLLKQKYPSIKCIIGDVFNYERIYNSTKNVDYVIHTAALKHVNISEDNPEEAINTNIIGSKNIITACIENKVKKVIFISTDKANNANCLYGSTKYISDKLCLNANTKSSETIFSIVRFGNIFGSKGSIIEKFYNISKETDIFPITSMIATRCFICLDDIYETIKFTIDKMKGGEIFIPKMKTIKISDLPTLIRKDAQIKKIDFKSFEKEHEDIITYNDLQNLYETEKYYIITENNNEYGKSTLSKKIDSSDCDFFTEEEFNTIYLQFIN